jgi:hypothetical protein
MELATEPDVYSPSIDENGNYIDKIPSFNTNALANGLRCPCGTRKDKVYLTGALFAAHCKSKTHEKWVQDLNTNKSNFFTENQKLRDVVHAQKIMIGKLELDVSSKNMTIGYLTHELTKIMATGTKDVRHAAAAAAAAAATPTANDMLMF